ncbi:MAG: hypothetical protein ACKO9A_01925 [Alphaproteobacteria bacterium]
MAIIDKGEWLQSFCTIDAGKMDVGRLTGVMPHMPACGDQPAFNGHAAANMFLARSIRADVNQRLLNH